MATKEHQTQHSFYCEKLANTIQQSELDYEELYIENSYGESMDLQKMENVGGQEHGDFDILVGFGAGYLYIEIKTNPCPEDLKKGQEQLSKATYLLDQVEYGLVIKDSQIDELSPKKVSDWELTDKQFEIVENWLTENDKSKTKPTEYKSEEDSVEEEIKISETDNSSWEEPFKPANKIDEELSTVFPRLAY